MKARLSTPEFIKSSVTGGSVSIDEHEKIYRKTEDDCSFLKRHGLIPSFRKEKHATLGLRDSCTHRGCVRHARMLGRVTSSGSITIIGRNDGETRRREETRGNQRHESRDAVPVGIN